MLTTESHFYRDIPLRQGLPPLLEMTNADLLVQLRPSERCTRVNGTDGVGFFDQVYQQKALSGGTDMLVGAVEHPTFQAPMVHWNAPLRNMQV
jgi:hypothetical protein